MDLAVEVVLDRLPINPISRTTVPRLAMDSPIEPNVNASLAFRGAQAVDRTTGDVDVEFLCVIGKGMSVLGGNTAEELVANRIDGDGVVVVSTDDDDREQRLVIPERRAVRSVREQKSI